MKTADEIIESHRDDDGNYDLAAALAELTESLPRSPISFEQQLNLHLQHLAWVNEWITNLVLELMDQAGALPLGKQAEMANARLAFELDLTKRLYEQLRANSQPSIVVPGR